MANDGLDDADGNDGNDAREFWLTGVGGKKSANAAARSKSIGGTDVEGPTSKPSCSVCPKKSESPAFAPEPLWEPVIVERADEVGNVSDQVPREISTNLPADLRHGQTSARKHPGWRQLSCRGPGCIWAAGNGVMAEEAEGTRLAEQAPRSKEGGIQADAFQQELPIGWQRRKGDIPKPVDFPQRRLGSIEIREKSTEKTFDGRQLNGSEGR
ncbi:hypothetical protein HDU96_004474 [Phlyctochytrium bullatum]|nr:hypothetical protein HDU96_004474 [Phlyctochytrium bullatum]